MSDVTENIMPRDAYMHVSVNCVNFSLDNDMSPICCEVIALINSRIHIDYWKYIIEQDSLENAFQEKILSCVIIRICVSEFHF